MIRGIPFIIVDDEGVLPDSYAIGRTPFFRSKLTGTGGKEKEREKERKRKTRRVDPNRVGRRAAEPVSVAAQATLRLGLSLVPQPTPLPGQAVKHR
jgi:hypothetical protein